MAKLKKILLLGSGALKIGEAGEFDYSGSQAMKALKEEGIKTVLINPNIATIQTSPLLADQIYFLPVNDYFVEKVIEKEKPDAILLSFGGQTALNCGVSLHRKGILKKHKVKILGTPVEAIILTEDRDKFAKHLRGMNIPVPPSQACTSLVQAEKAAQKIGFPLMVRAAYALGGQKSGIAHNKKELKEIVNGALSISPQVLVERYLHHFKEIEYEVVRDRAGNCVTVCNMENLDPLGIHTGDSIVVAPSQTLTNTEYHGLRQKAIEIVQSLKIVGECNVQYALNPNPKKGELDYYVIEVNARLSRSSALASKATGYPLAYVAAKLALNKLLADVPNQVTKVTQSFFEPALDYVVVKIPRWDLEKFKGAEERIGSAMKSVGEVMSIGRTFEEALQKGIRMLNGRLQGVTENGFADTDNISDYIKIPTSKRIFAVAKALSLGSTVNAIHKLSGIDPWFINRIKNIVDTEANLAINKDLGKGALLNLKQLGFSDKRIGRVVNKSEEEIRKLRKSLGLKPSVFQIDTLAGEVPAKTNYLYLTYNGSHHDVAPLGKSATIVLGSGPYHIGSSVEFDWSCVHTALALKKFNKKSIIINCNPETVSTDYDMSDRLYFEDLNFETVADIYEFEKAENVIISVGGQRPNNLANALATANIKVLGTVPSDIDRAEDRNKFSKLLDKLKIDQPKWNSFTSLQGLKNFVSKEGFPVLVRPSYVLSGSAMNVCYNQEELENFVAKAAVLNTEHPVTVSKFMTGAKELELDAVAQNGIIQISAISEHIENAGVHSGDATIAFPPQKVYMATAHQLNQVVEKLAKALNVTGPLNIQFLVKDNRVYVIEMNIRASRTFPLISKATGVNFPDIIVASFFNKSKPRELPYPDHVVVKSPQFSFARLAGADPVLRVEMSSTGEVACFGDTLEEALLKSLHSTTQLSNKKTALLSIGGSANKERFLESAKELTAAGFVLYATGSTHLFLNDNKIENHLVHKVYEKQQPNVVDLINGREVAFVINISDEARKPENKILKHATDGFLIRRSAVDNNTPLFTDLQLAKSFVTALTTYSLEDLKVKAWKEYFK